MIGRCAISISGRQRQRLRPSPFRGYASTPSKSKKDLPPPLPPRASSSSSQSTATQKAEKLSPAAAKKEYLAAQKKTGEFLKDPRAEIARLQADMNKTKEMLARVHDKPIWRRVIDRFKAKQHALINFLAASMAYILAHRLHLQMKANEELREKVETETATTFELRSLLRSLVTEEFSRDVVAQSQAAQAANDVSQDDNDDASANDTSKSKTTKSSGWFWPTREGSSALSSSARDALAVSLRQALEARIGDERLEDADRKQKNLQDIWKENEQRIENTDEGLAALAAALAVEQPNTNDAASTGTPTAPMKDSTKKRVFDM